MMTTSKRYFRTPAAAAYMGIAASTLEKDRINPTREIPFIKAGKIVLYDREDLDAYLADCKRRSTSDTGEAA